MWNRRIVIGTRGSKLARAQADIVVQRLLHQFPHQEIETRIIVTSGDRNQHSRLSEIGGKGIFIRELEQALIDGTIDIAVHSFKDVTSQLAPSLSLVGFFTPESVCDVLVTKGNRPLAFLPPNARVGTGSMRRRALLHRIRPDIRLSDVRGNIDTRIAKVDRGEYDGILLSEAGLVRLGLEDRISERFDPYTFYPAPGQGVITLEARTDDADMRELGQKIGDARQRTISTAEFALLTTIGFDCRTPLGVYTKVKNDILLMCGFFIDYTTWEFRENSVEGRCDIPEKTGKELALKLLGRKEAS
jgi:hydroxymethylbilane synthase